MSTRPTRRKYESSARQAQAAETRRRLTAAARGLFAARGYGAATIAAIAAEAGVSAQTVYATFGSKRGLLLAMLDQIEDDADLAAMQEALRAQADDPPAQLRLQVEFAVRLFKGAGELLSLVRGSISVDDDLRSFWATGERRRREGQAFVVESWARSGALRPGLTAAEAADVLWGLTDPDVYDLFVSGNRWTPERFRDWLELTLRTQLFGPAPG
jgi:AcrR family transcriptional regulator